MGSSVGFFCADKDDAALLKFGRSLGLTTVAPTIDGSVSDDASQGPYCLWSVVPKVALHPYGQPPIKVTDAVDPVMRFMRAYFNNPYLVAGHIYWSNDMKSLSVQTRPYFQKLSKWIKSNWEEIPGSNFYIGPQAKLLLEKGAELVNVMPGSTVLSTIEV